MIVCVCHRVSDRDIEREVRAGCCNFDALQDELKVATACGACNDCARHAFARHCAARHGVDGASAVVSRGSQVSALGALG